MGVRKDQAKIRLCGHMAVEIDGRQIEPNNLPGRQGRLLLAYLVISQPNPVRRDKLIDVVWEGDARGSDALLNILLSRLRKALGHDRLESRHQVWLQLPEDTWVDVKAIDQLAAAAHEALGEHLPEKATTFADEVLALSEAEFLPGFEGEWITRQRRDIEDIRLSTHEVLVDAGLQLGGVALQAAERSARTLVEQAPYRESGYTRLMRALAARGDFAEAVRVYDHLRGLLIEELGTTPGPDVTRLNERLLRQEDISADVKPADRPRVSTWAEGASEEIPTPPRLASASHTPFVGRAEAQDRLCRWWERTSFRARVAAIVGPPGIGKTRLAACFVRQVHAGGGTVLYGRCDADPLTSFQPFVEALDHYLHHVDVTHLQTELPDATDELRRLPPLRGHLGGEGTKQDSDRYMLFEAIAAVLRRASGTRRLLVVLDDLHWSDGPTFQLLLHLLRSLDTPRCAFAVTLRDIEASPAAGAGDARHTVDPPDTRLAELRREADVERVYLEGLDEAETSELIAEWRGRPSGGALARSVKDATGGNPFFIEEAVRSLAEVPEVSGTNDPDISQLGVPAGVNEVITRRLERLGEGAKEAMAVASVIGSEFRLSLLEDILGWPDNQLLDSIEALRDAQLLVEVPTRGDHFAFAHALVRESQYERLSLPHRVHWHERIAFSLERHARDGLGAGEEITPGELAHHFFEARHRLGGEKAVQYCLEAAERARRSLAHEEAASHYRRAAEALELVEPSNDEQLCDVRLAQGKALLRAGKLPAAREVFDLTAANARRRRSANQLARAALGYHGMYTPAYGVHSRRVALLEESLEALGSVDSPLRARVLGRLADSLLWVDGERARELSDQALGIARALQNEIAILEALSGRHAALLHADHLDERLALTAERLAVARQAGSPEAEAAALRWRMQDLCEHGEVPLAKEHLARLNELEDQLNQPLYLSFARDWASVFAQVHGRYAEAERLGEEALELSMQAGAADAETHWTGKRFSIYRERARLGELRPTIERLAHAASDAVTIGAAELGYTTPPPEAKGGNIWFACLALMEAELGQAASARARLESLVAEDAAALPRDLFWLLSLSALADTCGSLDDTAEAASVLYELMRPYEEQWIMAGPSACWGSVSRFLGVLAGASGDFAAGELHFQAAASRHSALGSWPLLARTLLDHGEMLLKRGTRGDRQRAADLLSQALEASAPLEKGQVATRAKELGKAVRSRPHP